MSGRNPVITWCISVSSLTATLSGMLATDSGHGFWNHVLFWVVLVTTIPALGYMLLVGAGHTSRWFGQRLSVISWRRVHWSIPVGAIVISLAALGISQLVSGGGHAASTPQSGSQSVTTLVGPDNTLDATEGLSTAPGTVAFSADGKTVAVDDCAGGDYTKGKAAGRVYLWSVATHKLETSLSVPPHGSPDCGNMPVSAFSRDGKLLATGDTNSDVTYLWHAGSDRLTATLDPQYGGTVTDVAFSPDSRTLVVVNEQGDTTLWSMATDKRIADINGPSDSEYLSAVAFSPNGKLLAFAEYGGKTDLVSVAHGSALATVTDPPDKHNPDKGDAEVATFSHDGKILATGDGDGRTYLWNVADHRLVAALSVPGTEDAAGEAPNTLFSPVNNTLATSDSGGNVYLWNITTRKVMATFSPPDVGFVLGLAFSPNGRMLAICEDGTTYLWSPS